MPSSDESKQCAKALKTKCKQKVDESKIKNELNKVKQSAFEAKTKEFLNDKNNSNEKAFVKDSPGKLSSPDLHESRQNDLKDDKSKQGEVSCYIAAWVY